MTPKVGTVPGSGISLRYREWPGDAAPIVLLHGLSSSSVIWTQVAEHLASRFRVIALDQRGHGGSDKPDEGYDFATIRTDLERAVDALGVRAPTLVGHSWGGNVALDAAVHMQPPPSALVLVDGGWLEPSKRMTWEEAEERLRPPNVELPLEEFRARIRERLGARWSDAWETSVLSNFWVDAEGIVRRNLTIENHMKIVRHMYGHKPSDLFARVPCPTVLVPAEMDPTTPEAGFKREAIEAAEMALGTRHARTVWMRETVHDIPLQRPADLAEVIAAAAAPAETTRPS